jgi:hypothetical protein
MLSPKLRPFFSLSRWPVQLVAAGGTGLILGLAALRFSPLWVLAALIGVGVVLFGLWRPEILVLAYLVLTSSVFRVTRALSFSLGFATVYYTDVLLLLLFGLIAVRWLVERNFKLVRTPLDWPLLIFWCAALLSTLIAIIGSALPWQQSLGEVRVVTSYLLFFAVTNLVRDRRRLVLLVEGLLLLAAGVAVATAAQYLVGSSQSILAGRVAVLATEGQVLSDVTRVIPPGQSLMVVAFVAVFTLMVLERVRLIDLPRFLQLGLLGLGIMITFFRASWGAIALMLALLGFVANKQERQRFIGWVLVAALSVSMVIMVFMLQSESRGLKLAQAAFDRLSTLASSSTYEDPQSSLQWRMFEYSYALPHIWANPIIGLGLGARYRPLTSKDWAGFDGRPFVHNGHIYILLKTGIFGYLGLMVFLLGVLVRGLRYWRRIPDPYLRGIALAFALTSLAVLLVSILEPYVMTTGWTPVIGVTAGVNEVIFNRFSEDASVVGNKG